MNDIRLASWRIENDDATGEQWLRVYSFCVCSFCSAQERSDVTISVHMENISKHAASNALMAFLAHTGRACEEWAWLGDSAGIWPDGVARRPRAHIDELACAALLRSAIDNEWDAPAWRRMLASEVARYEGSMLSLERAATAVLDAQPQWWD